MIVHNIGHYNTNNKKPCEHKKIYVSCAINEIKKRDMLISFKQRWEFYTTNTFDFLYFDKNSDSRINSALLADITNCIKNCDGMMALVSNNINNDDFMMHELSIAIENNIPIAGIDIRKRGECHIPDVLQGKMIKWGWEWISDFIDSL